MYFHNFLMFYRYDVINMAKNIIHARLAEGPHKGEDFIIYRIKTIPKDVKMPFEMERMQFPVRLSFSITSNKSQGQTYDFIGIDLTHHFFTHGQAYVAKSRVGSAKLIKIYQPSNCPTKGYMKNVVYPEILASGKINSRRSAPVARPAPKATKPFYPNNRQPMSYTDGKKLTTDRLQKAGFELSENTKADGNCIPRAILDQMR